MGLKRTLSLHPFLLDIKYAISARWLANPNYACRHSPHSFWRFYEYLIHGQSKDSSSYQMMIYVPANMLTLVSIKVNLFWASNPNLFTRHSFLVFVLRSTSNHLPSKCRFSFLRWGTSTLYLSSVFLGVDLRTYTRKTCGFKRLNDVLKIC